MPPKSIIIYSNVYFRYFFPVRFFYSWGAGHCINKCEMEKKMKGKGNSEDKFKLIKNIVPGIGLILIVVSIFFLVAHSNKAIKVFAFTPFLLIVFGATMIYLGMTFLKKGIYIFIGLSSTMLGVLKLLLEAQILPYKSSQIWPIAIIIFGISLMPAGIYNFKRLRSIYLFPAITMILLGVFFMLFSLDIVKMSFAEFFINWWPLLLLIAGVLLVGIFFVQQILKKDFPYMEDDSLEDGDENETEKKI